MKNLRPRFPIYSALLRLYPMSYRKRYGEEILQTTADMLDETPNSAARFTIWSRIAFNLPVNVGRQQLNYIGGVMSNETPYYLKRNSLVAGILVLPFFVAIAANALDTMARNHTLYHSLLWSAPILITWGLTLPLLAFVVAFTSYVLYSASSKSEKSVVKRALDIKHTWPIVLTGLCGLGIVLFLLFHDSAHCWLQNPVHTVTNLHQTLQCTDRGLLGA